MAQRIAEHIGSTGRGTGREAQPAVARAAALGASLGAPGRLRRRVVEQIVFGSDTRLEERDRTGPTRSCREWWSQRGLNWWGAEEHCSDRLRSRPRRRARQLALPRGARTIALFPGPFADHGPIRFFRRTARGLPSPTRAVRLGCIDKGDSPVFSLSQIFAPNAILHIIPLGLYLRSVPRSLPGGIVCMGVARSGNRVALTHDLRKECSVVIHDPTIAQPEIVRGRALKTGATTGLLRPMVYRRASP